MSDDIDISELALRNATRNLAAQAQALRAARVVSSSAYEAWSRSLQDEVNARESFHEAAQELGQIMAAIDPTNRYIMAGDAQPEPIPDVLRGIRIRPEDTTAAPAATPLDNGAHPPRTETTTI